MGAVYMQSSRRTRRISAPPTVDPPKRPFPVLWLFHGLSDDHSAWESADFDRALCV